MLIGFGFAVRRIAERRGLADAERQRRFEIELQAYKSVDYGPLLPMLDILYSNTRRTIRATSFFVATGLFSFFVLVQPSQLAELAFAISIILGLTGLYLVYHAAGMQAHDGRLFRELYGHIGGQELVDIFSDGKYP